MTRSFRARCLATSVLAAWVLFGSMPLAAQEPAADLPLAEDVLARHIEAVGGRDAVMRITSTRAVGEFTVPGQGLAGDLEILTAAPNKLFVRITVPGFGEITTGFDGEVGWTINPAMGPMLMEGAQLDQMREQADYYGLLNRDRYAVSMETIDRITFDQRPCYAVRVVTKWGEEYVEYYDVETGLYAGNVRAQESPMGAVETTTVVRGYQDFGGVLGPTETIQSAMNIEQRITIDTVEYDTVDPAVFALPPAIQTMIEPAGPGG